MQAFLGKASVKREYLARIRAHRKADELIHGVYWDQGKGCAVGCTVHSGDHRDYETQLGIPQLLARLEDGIFESLPNDRAQEWPERFLSAIEPGADLSLIWPKFAVWLLVDPKYGVLQFAETKQTKKVIQDVADAFQGVLNGEAEKVDWARLRAASYAASANAANASANASAAYANAANANAANAANASANAANASANASAAYAYAANASYAAANAANAANAADAAANAAANVAKQKEWRIAQSDKLIELLKAATQIMKRRRAMR